MWLQALKRKSVARWGSQISGRATNTYMVPQGPYGRPDSVGGVMQLQALVAPAMKGFSINGPHRNVGGVGREMANSRMGTPFRGQHPVGWGGHLGTYKRPEPMFNVARVETQGGQFLFNKASVLSNRGMLARRFKWINGGQYPHYWVQPVYPSGSLSDNASQGLYIHNKSSANDCVDDVNRTARYIDHEVRGSCSNDGTKCRQRAPYTKTIYQPLDASEQIHRVQRRCVNPSVAQRPFPYASNRSAGCSTGYVQLAPDSVTIAVEDPEDISPDLSTYMGP